MSLTQEILRYSRQDHGISLSNWFENQLDSLIDRGIFLDLNALEDSGQKIISALIDYSKKYKINSVVLGMSGGVDSALTAALFKAAGWQVTGLVLPIHQNPEETARGLEACEQLGIEYKIVDLTDTYEALLKSFIKHDKTLKDEKENLRRGNLRVRLRMMTVYNEAARQRGLVGSTDNFSELAAGFWTLHGDVGDLAPIQSLVKSWEVPRLAEIYGVPSATVFATPTDGLGISKGDEDQFGFSYLEFDIVLLTAIQRIVITREKLLIDLDVPQQDLARVNQILDRIKMSAFKRKNPYNIVHPLQDNRYPGLAEIDFALWR